MLAKFIATVLTRTETSADGSRLEITAEDGEGHSQTLALTVASAELLKRALDEFTRGANRQGPLPTKMPKSFAIGSGRYEPVVLVRFEDDVPYGLAPAAAAQLGRALVAEARNIAAAPKALCQ